MEHQDVGIRDPKEGFIERLAKSLGATANAANIYGAPIERDGTTIIPVARALYGFGGGSGRKGNELGGGGGGGVSVTPLGFIEIIDAKARFRSFRDPLMLFPLVAAGSLLTFWVVRGIYRLLRQRESMVDVFAEMVPER